MIERRLSERRSPRAPSSGSTPTNIPRTFDGSPAHGGRAYSRSSGPGRAPSGSGSGPRRTSPRRSGGPPPAGGGPVRRRLAVDHGEVKIGSPIHREERNRPGRRTSRFRLARAVARIPASSCSGLMSALEIPQRRSQSRGESSTQRLTSRGASRASRSPADAVQVRGIRS